MKQQPDTIFVPAGSAQRLSILGMTHHTMIAPDQTDGQFTAIVLDIPPECGPPMHSHATDSEFFYVLEGTLTLSDPDGEIRPGRAISASCARGAVTPFATQPIVRCARWRS